MDDPKLRALAETYATRCGWPCIEDGWYRVHKNDLQKAFLAFGMEFSTPSPSAPDGVSATDLPGLARVEAPPSGVSEDALRTLRLARVEDFRTKLDECIDNQSKTIAELRAELARLKAAPSEEEIEKAVMELGLEVTIVTPTGQATGYLKIYSRDDIARAILKHLANWAMPEWESVSKETQEHITKILNEVASCRYAPRVNHKLYYTAIRSAIVKPTT